ncbi:hypothetical protein KIL84_008669 [Mauremys mutica]|uniref:Uncharacterized protein n=1 Tax=Mauremys mutica TaxID=74926 RepID=A0A9D3X837_9SAUR|nr:hypothetical protein KIL84_008669 [Mauremys mutica]
MFLVHPPSREQRRLQQRQRSFSAGAHGCEMHPQEKPPWPSHFMLGAKALTARPATCGGPISVSQEELSHGSGRRERTGLVLESVSRGPIAVTTYSTEETDLQLLRGVTSCCRCFLPQKS